MNPAVDAYIDRAKPFAIPILLHLRGLIHKASTEVVEEIKWSRPFFSYKGAILCNISGFTKHCSIGFWGTEIGAVLREAGAVKDEGMGSLGKITSLKDLPRDKVLVGWLKQAMGFVDSGEYTSPIAARRQVVKAAKAEIEVPSDFSEALGKGTKTAGVWAGFSPSCKREYLEWITGAKRAETRAARIVSAVGWIGEGKQRNWKYQG